MVSGLPHFDILLASFSANSILCGSCWSRTNNVYPEGADLQSADAHTLASNDPHRILSILCHQFNLLDEQFLILPSDKQVE